MKHFIITTSCFFMLFAGLFSCSKKLEDNYADPDKIQTGDMGKLFTYMLYDDRIRPTYWDYATFVTGVTASYSQFLGLTTSSQMYMPSDGYNKDRWEAYYSNGIMNVYREIQKNYNNLGPAFQTDQYIFLQVAKVILYDQTSQMIDLWGDIPFSEAGGLNTTNTLTNARFDDAAVVYDTLINGLKGLNTYFSKVSLSNISGTYLKRQDILLGGDLALWRKYVNSLRLRLLMRVSYYKEAEVKTEVAEMLNNPDTYPLVNSNNENILLKMNPPTFSSEGLKDGLCDGVTSDSPYGPSYLIEDVMVANNDPRTDVFWDSGKPSYKGLSVSITASEAAAQIKAKLIATLDSGTFIRNQNVPGVLFTAAEISFLKAEAYERWGLGDAQTAYETGIKQSIAFYYGINQSAVFSGFTKNPVSSPSDATINAFIAGTGIAYSGTAAQKLEKIGAQKWVNFFILQAGQAWAEIRRTGYPKLTFADDPSTTSALQPPMRLLYPGTEKNYNADNYAKVAAKDTRDTKIFWDVN